jgi:hypothetical protein
MVCLIILSAGFPVAVFQIDIAIETFDVDPDGDVDPDPFFLLRCSTPELNSILLSEDLPKTCRRPTLW